jgi:hypothetical protein
VPFRQRQHEQHAVERDHRADGQINAAGDDDHADADAEDSVKPDEVGGVREVGLREERVVLKPGDGAHDDEQGKNSDFFFHFS